MAKRTNYPTHPAKVVFEQAGRHKWRAFLLSDVVFDTNTSRTGAMEARPSTRRTTPAGGRYPVAILTEKREGGAVTVEHTDTSKYSQYATQGFSSLTEAQENTIRWVKRRYRAADHPADYH